ncbi:MAG: AtpZ/AtpI family protein [Tenericutes bacterium]|nr:AtpZ/AtpI family protein [Mycoplasmatota bacterium]
MEPNKKDKQNRYKKIFMGYMLAMQFIFTIFGLALIGYFIGRRINPDSNLSTTLTAIGVGIGVVAGFILLVRMIQSEDRHERTSRH